MRKKSLRVLAALLAILMLLPALAGCGKKEGEDAQNPNLPAFVYVPEYIDVPAEIQDMSNVTVAGEKLYFSSYEYLEDANTANFRLYTINMDGTGLAELENYAPPQKPAEMADIENLEGGAYINTLCVDSQGNIWVAESANYYYFDLPADFNPETDDQWLYYTDAGAQMSLRKLDDSGAELLSVDLGILEAEADPDMGFYLGDVEIDDAGNIYVGDGNMAVYILDENGALQGKVESESWVENLVRLADGAVAASGYGENGYALTRIDPAAKAWGETVELPYNAYSVGAGGGDYLCTFGDNNNLYGLNKDSGEQVKLLNWIDCDINNDSLGNISVLPDGRVFCTNTLWKDEGVEYEMVLLSPVERASLPEKTVLTMATMYLDYNLRNAIIEFNKSSQEYRIQVNDYSEYNTEEDYNAGLTKLSTEIISGVVPDILDVSNLPVNQYAAKGLLEDLYPYLEKDPELGREDFFESILAAVEMDGKLYQINSSFSISTVAGSAKVLGQEPGWTMDEFMAVIRENPQATVPMGQYIIRNDFLYYAMMMGMDQYVDWATGQCSFDQGEFAKILEFANTFPAEYNYEDEETYVSEQELLQSGQQLMSVVGIGDFESIQMYLQMFGEDIVFKGFPNAQRINAVASIGGGLAMSSKCKDKEAAWSFMRTILDQEWQEENIWGFPTNKAAYDSKLEEAMTRYEDGVIGGTVGVVRAEVAVDSGMSYELRNTTQEEADMIMELIESVGGTTSYDEKMMEIINEEAETFFAGQRGAKETADIIQNRVSIYVAEQS